MVAKLAKLFFGGICVVFLVKLLSMSTWVYPDMWWYKDRGILLSLYYAMIYAVKPLMLIILLGIVYVVHGEVDSSERIVRIFALVGAITQLLINSSQDLIFYSHILSEELPTYVIKNTGWSNVLSLYGWVLGYFFGLAICCMYFTAVNQTKIDDDKNEKMDIWLSVIWTAGITSVIFPKLLSAFQHPSCGIIMDAKRNIANVIAQGLNGSFFFFIWGVIAVYLIGNKPLNAAVLFRRKVGVISAVALAYIPSWIGTITGCAPDVDFVAMLWKTVSVILFPIGYFGGYFVAWYFTKNNLIAGE